MEQSAHNRSINVAHVFIVIMAAWIVIDTTRLFVSAEAQFLLLAVKLYITLCGVLFFSAIARLNISVYPPVRSFGYWFAAIGASVCVTLGGNYLVISMSLPPHIVALPVLLMSVGALIVCTFSIIKTRIPKSRGETAIEATIHHI